MSTSKNKPLTVLLFSLLTLVITAVSAVFAVAAIYKVNGILTAAALMIIAIPFHLFAKKFKVGYIISWLLNSVGIGLAISCYYSDREISLELSEAIYSLAPAALLLILTCLILFYFPKCKKPLLISVAILIIALLITAAVFWIKNGDVFFSFGFFGLVVALIWIGVLHVTVEKDQRYILRDVSFGGFGAFIVIAIIVIALITDGDGVPELDMVIDSGSDNQKKKRKNNRG